MDAFKSAGSVCRASAGVCDVAETCSGSGAKCPDNNYKPKSAPCRASTRECDRAESCTGASASCPKDADHADGKTCSTGQCLTGACVTPAPPADDDGGCSHAGTHAPPWSLLVGVLALGLILRRRRR